MNTEKDIEQKIKAESEAFNNKIYDGPALPDDIMYLFVKGMMQSAPSDPRWTKSVVNKSVDKLTWKEVGIIMNFIRKLPYGWFFEDINEAADFHIHLNDLTEQYNEVMSELAAELEAKKNRMLDLLGGSPNGRVRTLKN